MREIKTHRIGGKLNDLLRIEPFEEVGTGGSPTKYQVYVLVNNSGERLTRIDFQNGILSDLAPPNGLSDEVLLAIVLDRLQGFQKGPFPCRENDKAMGHLEEAMLWLGARAKDRLERGVENKLQK